MKNYSIVVKQMIVLSLFIIIPIITITFIFNYGIMKYSEDEISKSGIGKLDSANNITSLLAQTISNDSVHLSLDETLNKLYGINDIKAAVKSSDNNLMLFQFVSRLSDIVRTNNAYSSVYLYLDNSNYIATSNGVYSRDIFADTTWLNNYLESKKLHKPLTWTNPRPSDTNGNNYVLSFIYPLTYTTNLKGSISINIYEKELSDLINSNNYDSSDFISIINSKGEVISTVDKTQLNKNISKVPYISKILSSKDDRGHFIDSINNKRYLITYLKTGTAKWTYVGVFSLSTLTDKVNSLKMSIIYISFFLLILFVLLSYVISRRLYNPVKKLVQEIKQRKGIDIIGNGNEFTLLAKTFDTMIKQEDQLFSTIEKDHKNLRENYLLSLLRGNPSIGDDQLNLFPLKNLMCCVLYIDKYNDFVTNFSYEHQYYLKTVILNLSEEKIGESFICSGVVLDGDKIVLVINFSDEDIINTTSVLKKAFSIVQQEAAKVIETTITVCLGGIYNDILKIRNSYIEAQGLVRQRFILGHQSFIYQKEVIADSSKKYFYPFNFEKQILNNVDIGSKDALLTSISNFFDEIKQNKDLTYDNAMLILNQLLGSTIKYMLDLNISVSKVFGNDFNIYSKLAEIDTLDEAGLFLSNIYLQIIEYNEKFKVEGKSHILKIMEYIHENYRKDIAINTLAEHVGLSYSHVRKIFNDETGENIVNYINNMRIEEAQRLLRQTNMNINDIALSLGYNNKQSFNRFFKKYVGINPGEYRTIKLN
ncbi:MAG TPA: AraC family transcriptional regulator [Ruminiclostridium sp.]|nr:AraC family transcriptional regulator [Ruminiclostridium sp.]